MRKVTALNPHTEIEANTLLQIKLKQELSRSAKIVEKVAYTLAGKAETVFVSELILASAQLEKLADRIYFQNK